MPSWVCPEEICGDCMRLLDLGSVRQVAAITAICFLWLSKFVLLFFHHIVHGMFEGIFNGDT